MTHKYWKNALKGEFGPIHEGEPQTGFYAQKARKGNETRDAQEASPVAIWSDESGTHAVIGMSESVTDADRIWTWVAQNPITYKQYLVWVKNGVVPEAHRPKAKAVKPSTKVAEKAPAPVVANNCPIPDKSKIGIGHNGGPDISAELAAEIKAETQLVENLIKAGVDSKDTAEKLGECGNRLLALKKKTNAAHKQEKAPWLEGGRAVDDRYKPLIKACDDKVKEARSPIDTWKRQETKRLEIIAEAERAEKQRIENERIAEENRLAKEKHEADKAEAERTAKEQAELSGASEAEIDATKADEIEAPKLQEAKEIKAVKADVSVGKATGKAFTTSRTVTTATILNMDELLGVLKQEPKFIEFVQSLADAAARSGEALAGTEITKQKAA